MFSTETSIKRHIERDHNRHYLFKKYLEHYCIICKKAISRSEKIFCKHIKQKHSRVLHRCSYCNKRYLFKEDLRDHRIRVHADEYNLSNQQFETSQGYSGNIDDVITRKSLFFMPYAEKSIQATILFTQKEKLLNECSRFVWSAETGPKYGKFMLCAHAFFIRFDESGDIADQKVVPMSTGHRLLTMADVENGEELLDWIAVKIESCKDKLEMTNSGWSFQYLSALDIEFIRLISVGGCLQNRPDNYIMHAVFSQEQLKDIPLKNYGLIDDLLADVSDGSKQDCFFMCIAYAICSQIYNETALSSSKSTWQRDILIAQNFAKMHFHSLPEKKYPLPFPIKKVKTFENESSLRSLNLAINVFTCHEGQMWPLYISENDKLHFKRINLLLLQPDFNCKNVVGHYVLIKDLSRFSDYLKKSKTRYNISNTYRPLLVCDLCLTSTYSQREFKTHRNACKNGNRQIIEFPKPLTTDAVVAFDHSSSRCREAPFIGFLDFEAKMSPASRKQNGEMYNCENCLRGGPINMCNHSERVIHEQIPMTYSFYIISTHDKQIIYSDTYSSDENLMPTFFERLDSLQEELGKRCNQYKKLFWSKRLQEIYDSETVCYICRAEFISGHPEYKKVRDHCHMTAPVLVNGILESKYLGASHNSCNRSRQLNTKVPIYIHNLMSYDSNFFFQESDNIPTQSVSGIPYNGNKLRCINMGNFRFLDSYQILSASLGELAADLSKDGKFDILKQATITTPDNFKLLLRKSVYPYEWARSVSQLENTHTFPPQSAFFSSLRGDTISDADYKHGCQVYKTMNCKKMLQYTELYCKLDTLLLAEIVFKISAI